jgi:hypothetical protein
LKRDLERRGTSWEEVTGNKCGKIETDGACYLELNPFTRETRKHIQIIKYGIMVSR